MGIPQSIADNFDENCMNLVWLELKTRFGFNLAYWQKEFREQFSRQPRNVTDVEFFLIFGNRSINDVLNKILGRRGQHPTFNRLVEYVISKGTQASRRASSGYSKRR